jgi:hypothetical protein
MYTKIKTLSLPLFVLATFISVLMCLDQDDIILAKLFNALAIIFMLCVLSMLTTNRNV